MHSAGVSYCVHDRYGSNVPVMSPNQAKSKPTADDIIDVLRQQRGLNYSQLSRASAIPRPTLCNKIEHIDRFTFGELKRLSLALNVELIDLIERAA